MKLHESLEEDFSEILQGRDAAEPALEEIEGLLDAYSFHLNKADFLMRSAISKHRVDLDMHKEFAYTLTELQERINQLPRIVLH